MVVCRVALASDAWSIYHPIGLSNGGCSGCRRLVEQVRFNFAATVRDDADGSFSVVAQIPATAAFVEATHRLSLRAALRSPNSIRVSR